MKLLPHSLLGRTLLLIILLLVISQLLSNFLFQHYYLTPRIEQRMALVGANLKSIAQALQTLPNHDRLHYLQQLAKQQQLLLLPAGQKAPPPPPPPKGAPKPPPLAKKFAPFAPTPPGAKPDIRLQTQGKHVLWVDVGSGADNYWIGIPVTKLQPRFSWLWLVWLITGGLVILFWAAWLIMRINRPLAKLTVAAEKMGRGEMPEKLAEMGTREVSELSSTFNQMAEDLQTLYQNRTLLLAGVSHDLRTPLARLRLAIEMLPDSVKNEQKKDMIVDIEDMDRIIEQFLAYVRHGSEEAFITGDINNIIKTVCARFSQQEKIYLQLSPLKKVKFKPIALQRLLANLINNALVHAKSDVEIQSQAVTNGIMIRILDRGPGIAAEDINKLFQPFAKYDNTRAITSGLGLAICKRIAEDMGVKFCLQGREGGGLEARLVFVTTKNSPLLD